MTKQDLIERVMRTKGLPADMTKKAVTQVVDAVFHTLGEYFVRGEATNGHAVRFTFPGFGTFTRRRRGPRAGRHPRTGAPIQIPGTVTVGFAPGQGLKALLNGG